jgi:hypothetical protein
MAPYSMHLRTRVSADSDAGVAAKERAAKFRVSRSWVNRLVQRRRETGEVRPRPQRVFKKQAVAGQEDRLRALVDARPDLFLQFSQRCLRSSFAGLVDPATWHQWPCKIGLLRRRISVSVAAPVFRRTTTETPNALIAIPDAINYGSEYARIASPSPNSFPPPAAITTN